MKKNLTSEVGEILFATIIPSIRVVSTQRETVQVIGYSRSIRQVAHVYYAEP
jgi:hypothetical protein